jgi:hypothetical protein
MKIGNEDSVRIKKTLSQNLLIALTAAAAIRIGKSMDTFRNIIGFSLLRPQ